MRSATEFVPTSIGKTMVSRMNVTHVRQGISIFAGPPGIGKTTAIEEFASGNPGQVAVMKVSTTNAKDRLVMRHAIEAMRGLTRGCDSGMIYLDAYQARVQLARTVESWARGIVDTRLWGDPDWIDHAPPLTFVFDEAQNLSRAAIEALRYWNDQDRCYSPVPIGLVFVGNNEFSLEAGRAGQSVISAAVADRALYVETFDYEDVKNADLKLILAAHGITDEMAVAAVVKHFSSPRSTRSLRSLVNRVIADLHAVAGEQSITLETVRTVLAA